MEYYEYYTPLTKNYFNALRNSGDIYLDVIIDKLENIKTIHYFDTCHSDLKKLPSCDYIYIDNDTIFEHFLSTCSYFNDLINNNKIIYKCDTWYIHLMTMKNMKFIVDVIVSETENIRCNDNFMCNKIIQFNIDYYARPHNCANYVSAQFKNIMSYMPSSVKTMTSPENNLFSIIFSDKNKFSFSNFPSSLKIIKTNDNIVKNKITKLPHKIILFFPNFSFLDTYKKNFNTIRKIKTQKIIINYEYDYRGLPVDFKIKLIKSQQNITLIFYNITSNDIVCTKLFRNTHEFDENKNIINYFDFYIKNKIKELFPNYRMM
jgi:hypothetical protein